MPLTCWCAHLAAQTLVLLKLMFVVQRGTALPSLPLPPAPTPTPNWLRSPSDILPHPPERGVGAQTRPLSQTGEMPVPSEPEGAGGTLPGERGGQGRGRQQMPKCKVRAARPCAVLRSGLPTQGIPNAPFPGEGPQGAPSAVLGFVFSALTKLRAGFPSAGISETRSGGQGQGAPPTSPRIQPAEGPSLRMP